MSLTAEATGPTLSTTVVLRFPYHPLMQGSAFSILSSERLAVTLNKDPLPTDPSKYNTMNTINLNNFKASSVHHNSDNVHFVSLAWLGLPPPETKVTFLFQPSYPCYRCPQLTLALAGTNPSDTTHLTVTNFPKLKPGEGISQPSTSGGGGMSDEIPDPPGYTDRLGERRVVLTIEDRRGNVLQSSDPRRIPESGLRGRITRMLHSGNNLCATQ